MRITNKHILFWGDWPSNWYSAKFNAFHEGKELTFFNTEQYFMWKKAITFNDQVIADEILKTKDPKKAKALGRQVKGYNNDIWNAMRYKVMLEANIFKYTQNEDLKKELLREELKGKGFVECSPYDLIWGVGIYEDEDDADDETKWKGKNLLGQVLNETRERILKEDYII